MLFLPLPGFTSQAGVGKIMFTSFFGNSGIRICGGLLEAYESRGLRTVVLHAFSLLTLLLQSPSHVDTFP